MINVAEIFQYCGMDGVPDVATSLANQNVMDDISFPVFEGVYLKIIPNGNLGFLCSSIQEAAILQHLGRSCGTVGIALNIMDMDFLTVLGCVCTFTPRSGANIFFKNNIPDLTQLTEDAVEMLAGLSALPFDPMCGGGQEYMLDLANQAIQILFDRLIDKLNDEFSAAGIGIHPWEELAEFRHELIESGELAWMQRVRAYYQLPTI